MQTVFNTDFHLDGVVAVWGHTVGVHPDVFLFGYVRYAPGDGHADKISSKGDGEY
jgi:hypothetical protein